MRDGLTGPKHKMASPRDNLLVREPSDSQVGALAVKAAALRAVPEEEVAVLGTLNPFETDFRNRIIKPA